MIPTLTTTHVADSAINPYRIVAHGDVDGQVYQADDAIAPLIGVASSYGAAAGERVDVYRAGLIEVEYGDTVTRGALLTSDADGKAVAAAPAAGVNAAVIGQAEVSGVSGDIGQVLIAVGQIQG